jgi:transcriptional regulator with XRE-family HTH domain
MILFSQQVDEQKEYRMNIIQLKRQLKKRKENKHYEIKPIGSAIRIKRKELKMTLEEGAEGICSVSYLSKLETNQIDPNIDFVERLVERFDLKEKIAYNQEQYEKDLITLTDWMIHLTQPDMSILEHYEDRKDHQAYLIYLVIYALLKQKDEMHDFIRSMHAFIPHLRQEELTLFLLCVSQWLLQNDRYLDAYHVVLEIPHQHESFYDHYLLTLRMRLMIAFEMHHDVDLHQFYHHYIQEVNHQGYYHLAKEMRQKQLIYLAHTLSPDEIKHLQQTSDRYLELGERPLALSYFMHQKNEDVIHLAHKQTHYQGWIFIYLVSLYRLGHTDEINAFLEKQTLSHYSPSEQMLMKWMHARLHHDPQHLLHMIRNHFTPDHLVIDHPTIIPYIMMDAAKTLAQSQFYKEAYHLLMHHHYRAQGI